MAFPKIDGYVVTEKLGSGSYSTVYKAYTKVGARSVVAVKCVDKARIKHSGSAIDNLITEIRLLKTLTHPHIVHMHNFTWDQRYIYIIMEYCCGGDLSRYIHKYGRIPEHRVLYFLQQLASALKFLREKGVVHMDLKPHNLLLHKGPDGKYILKVADFGFAMLLTTAGAGAGGVRGSPLYMAPEMVRGAPRDTVDLWSVGVIMYECLFGRAPYSSRTFGELMDKIEKQAPIKIPPSPPISSGCRELLSQLLVHDPDQRISYEEFFAHEYLDLDHMPTRENYEKGLSLMKQAVELDCSGALPEALAQYTAGLRFLVPAARAAPHSALTAKLARYMERAEEIKEYLKCKDTQPPSLHSADNTSTDSNCTNSPAGYTNSPAGYTNSPAGYTNSPVAYTNNPAGCTNSPAGYTNSPSGKVPVKAGGITACCHSQMVNTTNSYDFSNLRSKCASERECEEVNGTVEEPTVSDETGEPKEPPSGGRGGRLRRLLSRGSGGVTLPALTAGNTDEHNEDSSQKGDGCRIT